MAEQNSNNISVTGGTMAGVTITGYILTTQKGVANGVATLDAGGKVPVSELPAAVLGALSYQGTWDASTNTPTLISSVGTKGYYYVVSVAGNTNLNGITDWLVGDWAVFNGSVWQKVDNTDAVTSVNGQTGTVVLTTTNIAEGTNLYYTDARARGAISAGTGISYNSTTGVVTNAAPDQTVVLNAGTGISTSGTYPSFTITNTAPDQTVSITGAGTSVVTGTYPNFTVTSNDAFVGTVTSVAATAGTGISITGSPITTSGTLNITNTAPDQTVVLTAGTGISTSGTYPNFTITNTSPSLGGDVVGPASSTDNAIARFDTTTGKLLQNSVVTVGDTGAVSGVTTLAASTSVTTPIIQATNSAGLALRNSAGTTQISMGGGGGDNVTIAVATNINGANAQIDISPTGTGHVHIKPTGTGSLEIAPTNAGTMNNMVIGGTTPLAITGTTITANTQFSGAGTGLTGTATSLSIGGNAATVTNGVVTTGSYANPSWITSLDGSKITGNLDGGSF
jgi:hypothetical protein